MRISQLQSFTNTELSLLLYIVNEVEPIMGPKVEIGKNELLWIRHDDLLQKLVRQQDKLTDEGRVIFNQVLAKLSKTSQQEIEEEEARQKFLNSENLIQMELNYEYPTTKISDQSNFQF